MRCMYPHLVRAHGDLDVLARDLEVADVLDVVAGQLEDVRGDVLQHRHDVQRHLSHGGGRVLLSGDKYCAAAGVNCVD